MPFFRIHAALHILYQSASCSEYLVADWLNKRGGILLGLTMSCCSGLKHEESGGISILQRQGDQMVTPRFDWLSSALNPSKCIQELSCYHWNHAVSSSKSVGVGSIAVISNHMYQNDPSIDPFTCFIYESIRVESPPLRQTLPAS